MSKTRIIVLGLAVGSAIMAGYLAKGFLKRPTQVAQAPKQETTEVLVAARDIGMGDKIDAAALDWESWPKKNVSASMISQDSDPEAKTNFENGRARVALFQGEPISEKKIIKPNDRGFMSAILPKGRVAISVRISAETGAGGFILPNDKVDVILTRKTAGTERQVADTVLSNVRVLAVDQTFKQDDKGEQVVVGKTATLELDLMQAEVVSMAEQTGQLSLALRSLADGGDSALGDDGPRLSEKFINGSSGSEMTVSRWGVRSFTSSSQ
jgi:pilus assembly protein CpaB